MLIAEKCVVSYGCYRFAVNLLGDNYFGINDFVRAQIRRKNVVIDKRECTVVVGFVNKIVLAENLGKVVVLGIVYLLRAFLVLAVTCNNQNIKLNKIGNIIICADNKARIFVYFDNGYCL